jgi:manganese transport protein
VKKLLQVTLGILTAIGGFVDIGDMVANAETGARFRMSLAWVVVVGVIGIVVYAEMAGRVAAVSGHAVFDVVRQKLGARVALANLLASFFINFLTLTAEIAGVAIAFELATDVNYLLWIPLTGFLVWVVIWRVGFEAMERVFGLAGLALVAAGIAVWKLGPDWSAMLDSAFHPGIPGGEGIAAYWFFAVGLFGAAMTPYEVFFFSSGAVEEHWGRSDLLLEKVNVYVGFPLGGLLSLGIMASTSTLFFPRGITVDHLSQVALPPAVALGKVGLAAMIVGIFAATFGAALETGLSAGYTVAQYFGWRWGKFVRPADAPAFHVVVMLSIVLACLVGLTTVDPIKVTEYSIVLSAAALPLTYFPILVVANDPDYMGDRTNGRFANAIASVYLVLLIVVALVAIPLIVVSKGGA